MIVLLSEGGLGNQLFQQHGVQIVFEEEFVVFIGFAELTDLFPTWFHGSKGRKVTLGRKLTRLVRMLLTLLVQCRLLTSIQERRGRDSYEMVEVLGLFTRIRVVSHTFFQHREISARITRRMVVESTVSAKARKWLSEKGLSSKTHELVFLHLRRTDYHGWPSADCSAVLPLSWFEAAVKKVAERLENPLFVVVSDDKAFADQAFGERLGFVVSDNEASVDFAIMLEARHGILSPSTFAWWGAFYAQSSNAEGVFIAPMYWAGHRAGEWFPQGFVSDWLTYLPADTVDKTCGNVV